MTFATNTDLAGAPQVVDKNGKRYFRELFVINHPGGRKEVPFYCNEDMDNPRDHLWDKASAYCERHCCHLHGRVWTEADWKAHYAAASRARNGVPTT